MKKSAFSFLSILFLLLSACATSGGTKAEPQTAKGDPSFLPSILSGKPSAFADLDGVWVDTETNDLHTIVWKDGRFEVTSVAEQGDDQDAEKMELKSTEWKDNVLSWSYYVPSTGYTVYFKTVSVNKDELSTEWINRDSSGVTKSGKETLSRYVEDAEPSGEPPIDGEETPEAEQ